MSASPALGQIAISPSDQIVIPVLGMHQSGGSLVARLMNLMGLELGWPLEPVGEENPRGLWEHLLFQTVNMQLLNGFGAHPDAVGTPEGLHHFAQQMSRTKLSESDRNDLGARMAQNFMHPIWGWKDPRTAVAWPFWSNLLQELGYTQVKPVLVIRHPDACLRGLKKRDLIRSQALVAQMSEEDFVHSMWWAVYQVLLSSEMNEANTLILSTEDLLDPQTAPLEIGRLAAHMGVPPERAQLALDWISFSDRPRDETPGDANLAVVYDGLCSLVQEQRTQFLAENPVLPRIQRFPKSIPLIPTPLDSSVRFCIYQVSPSGYPHAAAFDEVALSLHYGLKGLGLTAPLVKRVEDVQGTPIVVGANLVGKFVDTLHVADDLPDDAILFNLEQIDTDSDWMTDTYLNLLNRFRVWDYSPGNIDKLGAMGIEVEGLCRIGHAAELARIDQNVTEDIDVLFYGGLNSRRSTVLQALRDRGLNVVVAANCFGEARDQLVARAKIVLNIHFYQAKVLEIVRISYLLSNGQCVVSETGADAAEEGVFQDAIAFSSYDGLVDRCVELAQDTPQRQRIAHRAKSLFSSMKQSDFLAELIQ
jgi:hypothetical protein